MLKLGNHNPIGMQSSYLKVPNNAFVIPISKIQWEQSPKNSHYGC